MRCMERQGFSCVKRVSWEGGTLAAWGHPDQRDAEDCFLQTTMGIACSVGPLWYQGKFGRRALALLLEDVLATGRLDEDSLRGNFALFLSTEEYTWLLNDAFGFVRIHSTEDGCFFSTSWLAACAYQKQVEINESSALEYVLLGAAHSCHSVALGIDLLPLGLAMDLKRRCTWQRFPGGYGTHAPEFISQDEALDAVAIHLRTVSNEVAATFPGKIITALSGGFDSRLIVAGLLAIGVQPRMFVYGEADSPDVSIARSIAGATGLSLDAIDKSIMNRTFLPPGIDSLEENALFFDGLPSDGIDDPGADRCTRLQQSAGGCIALNGGGGEIFRNFFHLPDQAYSARDIIRTFYRGFGRGVFRGNYGLENFESRLAESMRHTLGQPAIGRERLTRSQVELLYPLFRCHYWMGVNNSIAVRHGHYATPLVDVEFVRLSQRLPLRWKNAGKFQSRLITSMHPGIAAQPSSYGFRFDVGPGLADRLSEWATCARPVRLRPMVNATRRRLHKVRAAPELLQRYRKLLPGEWRMDPLLDLAKLPDQGALGRAMAIEVVWRRIF